MSEIPDTSTAGKVSPEIGWYLVCIEDSTSWYEFTKAIVSNTTLTNVTSVEQLSPIVYKLSDNGVADGTELSNDSWIAYCALDNADTWAGDDATEVKLGGGVYWVYIKTNSAYLVNTGTDYSILNSSSSNLAAFQTELSTGLGKGDYSSYTASDADGSGDLLTNSATLSWCDISSVAHSTAYNALIYVFPWLVRVESLAMTGYASSEIAGDVQSTDTAALEAFTDTHDSYVDLTKLNSDEPEWQFLNYLNNQSHAPADWECGILGQFSTTDSDGVTLTCYNVIWYYGENWFRNIICSDDTQDIVLSDKTAAEAAATNTIGKAAYYNILYVSS